MLDDAEQIGRLQMNPFDWTGPWFLLFYLVLGVFSYWFVCFYVTLSRTPAARSRN